MSNFYNGIYRRVINWFKGRNDGYYYNPRTLTPNQKKWIDRYIQAMHQFPFAKTIPEAGKTAVQKWFGERNPLEYKVEGSER